jgi:hypothetical protein
MTYKIDISGFRSGGIIALEPTEIRKHSRILWRCKCDCGGEILAPVTDLKAGRYISCGCSRKAGNPKHGHSPEGKPSRTYNSWSSMITRCLNSNNHAFRKYGAKGIKVCPEWKNFSTFLRDMGERPPGKTLDRFPDRNGDYKPGNCRWATPSEQNQNKDPPNAETRAAIAEGVRRHNRLRQQLTKTPQFGKA